tara:strand:+ start:310 stop:747 length:438 start_codon:yes stop_codon:yes gene_type:complete
MVYPLIKNFFMTVAVLKKEEDILSEINNNTPIIIYRNFLNKKICKEIVNICHSNFSLIRNKYLNFSRIDVLPPKVKTKRIFRTFELSNYFINKFTKIKNLKNFQKKIFKVQNKRKIYSKFQVIHYPIGGGFSENIVTPDTLPIMD